MLNFNAHIIDVVSKAHRRANLILRSFASRDKYILMQAFIVYVRPLLEYATIIWSPRNVSAIMDIEKVQRRFTKRLSGLKSFSYFERIKELRCVTLERRRLLFDLIMCFKIIHHLVDINFSDFFQIPVVNITRGHAFKLFVCHTRVKARANFFASYIVNVWNSLPCETVNAKSVTEFKARITRFKFSNFLLVKV